MESIRKKISCHLSFIPQRLRDVAFWYIFSLILPGGKRSLTRCSKISGKSISCFSSFLKVSKVFGIELLETLAKYLASADRSPLCPGSPWKIGIIIDSTLHKRSTTKLSNSQRLTHGNGWTVGHQWTNIVLLIGRFTIPLPPIPFYTKGYCKKHKIEYKTQNERIVDYLKKLNLKKFVGPYADSEVVLLLDSGYDDRSIMNVIKTRNWSFIMSLKGSSTATLDNQKNYRSVQAVFKGCFDWVTVRISSDAKRNKRKEFRVSAHHVFLNKFESKILLMCSESRRDSQTKRKYLACSELGLPYRVLVLMYRKRWNVELFHKDVKSLLGMESVGSHGFESTYSHVLLVYAAYSMLRFTFPELSILQAQEIFEEEYKKKDLRHIFRLSRLFGSNRKIETYCSAALEERNAA